MTDLGQMFEQAAVPMTDGSFMSAKIARVAELISEYDETLEVRWVKPNERTHTQPAFAIVATPVGLPEYVVFYVQDESEFDERVLARLFENDANKQGNVLSRLDAMNMAVRIEQERKREEEEMERLEVARSILKSPKARYRHNGRIYE